MKIARATTFRLQWGPQQRDLSAPIPVLRRTRVPEGGALLHAPDGAELQVVLPHDAYVIARADAQAWHGTPPLAKALGLYAIATRRDVRRYAVLSWAAGLLHVGGADCVAIAGLRRVVADGAGGLFALVFEGTPGSVTARNRAVRDAARAHGYLDYPSAC